MSQTDCRYMWTRNRAWASQCSHAWTVPLLSRITEPINWWRYVGPAVCASLELSMHLTCKKKRVSSKIQRKGEKKFAHEEMLLILKIIKTNLKCFIDFKTIGFGYYYSLWCVFGWPEIQIDQGYGYTDMIHTEKSNKMQQCIKIH